LPPVIGFSRIGPDLCCDELSIAAIAASSGTPVYIYSAAAVRATYLALDRALGAAPHTIHYALKANSTLGLARLLSGLGSGADANSVGEIEVALRAGFLPSHIVFTGVGKTPDELDRAVALDLKAINAESRGELERVAAVARRRGTRARVALRVNPDIDAQSHPHISTGLRTTKFGIPLEEAAGLYRSLREHPDLEFVGVHVHVGSQILSLDPLRRAAQAVVALAKELRGEGLQIEHVDVGGGLGISYDGTAAPSIDDYARTLAAEVCGTGLTLAVEPGRLLVGHAGALVARVTDVKEYPGGRSFAVLDAGMTELMRPALYGAYHRIEPVTLGNPRARTYDIVGPICESSDVFARERPISELAVGDLVAVLDTGAYGAAMASTYNRRPLAPEVLVDDGRVRTIRRRQTVEDMLALEE
jgi:diaminopimelate decarboxylase